MVNWFSSMLMSAFLVAPTVLFLVAFFTKKKNALLPVGGGLILAPLIPVFLIMSLRVPVSLVRYDIRYANGIIAVLANIFAFVIVAFLTLSAAFLFAFLLVQVVPSLRVKFPWLARLFFVPAAGVGSAFVVWLAFSVGGTLIRWVLFTYRFDFSDLLQMAIIILVCFFVTIVCCAGVFFLCFWVVSDGMKKEKAPKKEISARKEKTVGQNVAAIEVNKVSVSYNDNARYYLKTDRSFALFVILTIVTFGIYPIIVMTMIGNDVNTIASKHDGKRSMNFCLISFVFSWLTYGIVPIVWYHNLSARIGDELRRRDIDYAFGAGTFWGWCFFGSLIFAGPFIYQYKLLKAMNLLSEDYNAEIDASSGYRAAEAVAPQERIAEEAADTQIDTVEELKKYKELYDMGAITEEEYTTVKKRLLFL